MATRSEKKVWFSLFAPASAWAIQELASAVIGHVACAAHMATLGRISMIAITLVALGFSVLSAVIGLRTFRAVSEEPSLVRAEAPGRHEMLAFSALVLGVVFAVAIFWTGLPSLIVGDVCGAKR